MFFSFELTVILLLYVSAGVALAIRRDNPFSTLVEKRQGSPSSLTVDLGYEVYQGVGNATSGLHTWKGGSSEVASPSSANRESICYHPGNDLASQCPQNPPSLGLANAFSGIYSDEDCLFLNVYAPANASNLPVLVWIHGGGYGAGNGREDLTAIINANNKSFVGVAIQYRLGAFGFMSSDEIFQKGVVNAGLLDQHFALQWVQSYIGLFGGNASQVTISGESAGGGSVMLLDMAYGGTMEVFLFVGSIASSPYLPMQYGYKDWVPTQSYFAYANEVGCMPTTAYGGSSQSVFDCLVAKDTQTLQKASAIISASGTYGTWGFLPVTDGVYIQDTPSRQLLKRKVNGRRVLVGKNVDEGSPFTPHNITTEADLVAWLRLVFPMFSNDDISKTLLYYPSSNASDNANATLFATLGDSGPTALNQSDVATGQQQRMDNIYAETTFVCPAYWMVEAYAGLSGEAYKYQYSIPVATHGADVAGYFGPPTKNQGPDFVLAFQTIWGNFITKGNPSISETLAVGKSANSTSSSGSANPVTDWPAFAIYQPYQINLNQSGGTPFLQPSGTKNLTEDGEPGLKNNITLVNAYSWEGGRGFRCDFWRAMGVIVPE